MDSVKMISNNPATAISGIKSKKDHIFLDVDLNEKSMDLMLHVKIFTKISQSSRILKIILGSCINCEPFEMDLLTWLSSCIVFLVNGISSAESLGINVHS